MRGFCDSVAKMLLVMKLMMFRKEREIECSLCIPECFVIEIGMETERKEIVVGGRGGGFMLEQEKKSSLARTKITFS